MRSWRFQFASFPLTKHTTFVSTKSSSYYLLPLILLKKKTAVEAALDQSVKWLFCKPDWTLATVCERCRPVADN